MYNAAETFFVQSAVFCYWFVGYCRSKPHEPKIYFFYLSATVKPLQGFRLPACASSESLQDKKQSNKEKAER